MQQQKAVVIVDFLKMTCGTKATDAEKETICKEFFAKGVQRFVADNPALVNDGGEIREHAMEIMYHAIKAFNNDAMASKIHVWRPYAKRAGSSTPEKSVKSEPSDSVSSGAISVGKKAVHETAQSTVTPSQNGQRLEEVFESLSIRAKPTKAGLTGLKVDELNNICKALGGDEFVNNIKVVHGKRDKPVKADLVDGITKFLD